MKLDQLIDPLLGSKKIFSFSLCWHRVGIGVLFT